MLSTISICIGFYTENSFLSSTEYAEWMVRHSNVIVLRVKWKYEQKKISYANEHLICYILMINWEYIYVFHDNLSRIKIQIHARINKIYCYIYIFFLFFRRQNMAYRKNRLQVNQILLVIYVTRHTHTWFLISISRIKHANTKKWKFKHHKERTRKSSWQFSSLTTGSILLKKMAHDITIASIPHADSDGCPLIVGMHMNKINIYE